MTKRGLISLLAFMLMITMVCTGGLSAQAAETLSWHKTGNESNNLYDVAVNADSTYVAVGAEGTILSSSDARTWKPAYSIPTTQLHSVATNGKRFVAGGTTGAFVTSASGYQWSKIKWNKTYTFGDVMLSNDKKKLDQNYSINWKSEVKLAFVNVNSVIWDGKRFVAIGNWQTKAGKRKKNNGDIAPAASVGSSIVLTSADGITWAMKPINGGGDKLVYTGSKYVAIWDRVVYISKDLVQWKEYMPAVMKTRNALALDDLIYANGKLMAIGWDGNASARTGVVLTSADGINWNETINKTVLSNAENSYGKSNGFDNLSLNSILWDGRQYWIAGYKGILLHSADGKKWERWSDDGNAFFNPFNVSNKAGSEASINKMIFDGSRYVQVGNRGTIIVSERLKAAEVVRQRPGADLMYISFDGKDRYVAGGASGEILESADGYEWKPAELTWEAEYFLWGGLAAANGKAIVVGNMEDGSAFGRKSAEYYYSESPGVWEKKKFPSTLSDVESVSFQNGKFYVIASNGYVTSADGVNWSKPIRTDRSIASFATNGKTYIGPVSFGDKGDAAIDELVASSDGVKWKKIVFTINKKKYRIAAQQVIWDGKQFRTVGGRVYEDNEERTNGYLVEASSKDGYSWTVHKTAASHEAMAGNGQQFVAVEESGIYASSDGVTFKATTRVTGQQMHAVLWDGQKFIAAGNSGTIVVSKKPVHSGGSMAEEVEIFNIKYDPNEPEIVSSEVRALREDMDNRIAIVKQIGSAYLVTEEPTTDRLRVWIEMGVEGVRYDCFESGEYRNNILFYVDFDEEDEPKLSVAKAIISQHTGADKDKVGDLIQTVFNGKTEVNDKTTIDGIVINYKLTVNPDSGSAVMELSY